MERGCKASGLNGGRESGAGPTGGGSIRPSPEQCDATKTERRLYSECPRMRWNFSSEHEENSKLVKKMDCSMINRSSTSSNSNISTDGLLFPKDGDCSNVGCPLIRDQPAILQNANCLTPVKMESEPNLNSEISIRQTPRLVDFSTVKTADFGITPEAFTMPSKGGSKYRVNQLKRRSTIGVRGSPENNSLIRYIAHRRREKMQNTFTEANLSSCQNTLLKAKIAAFQSSFKTLEETEEKEICLSNTSKKAKTTSSEPSELGQVETSLCEKIALENNMNSKSMTRARKSAGVQSSTVASRSQKTLSVGMGAVSKAVPAQSISRIESGCMHLECTPNKETTPCGMKALLANEELSSCKKVRFAENQRLEIFDKTKLPVTPRLSCLSSSSLRSVLKKTPVKMFPESMTEDLRGAGREKGIEGLSDSCEPLQAARSTGMKEEVNQCKEDLDSDISGAYLPVDVASRSEGQVPFSPSVATEEGFPNVTPIKQSFPQPDFDDDKDPGSLEVVVKPECFTIPDLQETKNSPLGLQATCTRKTRSCAKRKCVSETEKTKLWPASKPQAKKNPKRKPSEFETDNPKAKPSHKKALATRRKVFGKRRKRKTEQKSLYGQRETVSKMPLLSPIPEVKEEISMVLSHQSMLSTHSSFLDDSNSCLHAESGSEPAENALLYFDGDNNSHLDLLNREAVVMSPSIQLQDGAVGYMQKTIAPDSPKSSAPEKGDLEEEEKKKLVLDNDYTPDEATMQKEAQLVIDENNKVSSETNPVRGSDAVDFKKVFRRSRRLTSCHPSTESFEPEAPGNEVAGNDTEGHSPVEADSTFLKHIETDAEDRSRKVRRSMRQHQDTENKGLVWISIPADHTRGQAPLGSVSKAKRRRASSSLLESDLLRPMQPPCLPVLFPVKEEQENVLVGAVPRAPKRRRNSLGVLSPKGNENILLRVQRNRRASLGYKSDLCDRKDHKMRTFFRNQPVV